MALRDHCGCYIGARVAVDRNGKVWIECLKICKQPVVVENCEAHSDWLKSSICSQEHHCVTSDKCSSLSSPVTLSKANSARC